MKKVILVALTLVVVLSGVLYSGQFSAAAAKEFTILEFNTMVGVPAGLTGTQSPIRNINGGGLPWTLDSAQGELKASGKLELSVQGLVLAAGANAGSNPIGNFRAVVSCLSGNGSVVNIATDPFPATTGPASAGGGDAKVEVTLSLPQPCIAPIIFVTSPGGNWFAVTGN